MRLHAGHAPIERLGVNECTNDPSISGAGPRLSSCAAAIAWISTDGSSACCCALRIDPSVVYCYYLWAQSFNRSRRESSGERSAQLPVPPCSPSQAMRNSCDRERLVKTMVRPPQHDTENQFTIAQSPNIPSLAKGFAARSWGYTPYVSTASTLVRPSSTN